MRHFSRLLGRSTRRATFATLASPAAKPSNGNAKFVYAATGTLIGAVAGYSALSFQLRDDVPPEATQRPSLRGYATEAVTLKVRAPTLERPASILTSSRAWMRSAASSAMIPSAQTRTT